MKKVFKVLFLGIALLVMSGVAQAQVKIAYIDSSEILEAMPESATAMKNLEKFAAELQNQFQDMAKEYQTKAQDYEANQASMSNLVRQSKEKELMDLQTRIQQFQANGEVEIATKREELLKPIIEKMQKAVNDVGKEKGYSCIIDNAAGILVYIGAETVNANKEVKAKLGIK